MSFGQKVWKKGFDEEFVTEAKRRGLTCGILMDTTTRSMTPKQRCKADLRGCSQVRSV